MVSDDDTEDARQGDLQGQHREADCPDRQVVAALRFRNTDVAFRTAHRRRTLSRMAHPNLLPRFAMDRFQRSLRKLREGRTLAR